MPDHYLFYLYGGDQPWSSEVWETSDDRVRGGSSQSYLRVVNPERARFTGHLDTKTLGGAGFASQHSRGVLDLDLSDYDGILVSVVDADDKRYAITLKDQLPRGRRPDGREKAAVSWEADFTAKHADGDMTGAPVQIFLPWSAFKPTYRGRDKGNVKPLDLTSIKRVGLMMRSFFGQQDGDFSIDIHAVAARRPMPDPAAVQQPTTRSVGSPQDEEEDEEEEDEDVKKNPVTPPQSRGSTWWRKLLCGLV
ncbi:complex I intermediate-associated protein 30-domain-containing protein [Stachybotrys elegans]|uniref:Complex I intermediate-associated protein 30-domain-containing protein n=1 Tax=Stachybotrys elegans TaxID=80388 RepID=A0A8K0SQE3_9HYPO|nr:complex I intermediate-associated protein 30-domain-containing protein [Stachybotrys elegans]